MDVEFLAYRQIAAGRKQHSNSTLPLHLWVSRATTAKRDAAVEEGGGEGLKEEGEITGKA
jgi:hypothetical protein